MSDHFQTRAAAGRPALREPKAAAGDDREPLRNARTAERKVRKRKGSQLIDPFFIAPEKIPDGVTYEWKRKSTFGQEDFAYQQALAENGWEPVDAKRHPELMPTGYTGEITREGLVLMERPSYLTEEARQEDAHLAKQQVRVKEQQLKDSPQDTFERQGVKVGKTYAPVEVPEE